MSASRAPGRRLQFASRHPPGGCGRPSCAGSPPPPITSSLLRSASSLSSSMFCSCYSSLCCPFFSELRFLGTGKHENSVRLRRSLRLWEGGSSLLPQESNIMKIFPGLVFDDLINFPRSRRLLNCLELLLFDALGHPQLRH